MVDRHVLDQVHSGQIFLRAEGTTEGTPVFGVDNLIFRHDCILNNFFLLLAVVKMTSEIRDHHLLSTIAVDLFHFNFFLKLTKRLEALITDWLSALLAPPL